MCVFVFVYYSSTCEFSSVEWLCCTARLHVDWHGRVTPRLPNCVLGSYMSPMSTVARIYWLMVPQSDPIVRGWGLHHSTLCPPTTPFSLNTRSSSYYCISLVCSYFYVLSTSVFLFFYSLCRVFSTSLTFLMNHSMAPFFSFLFLSVLFLQPWFMVVGGLQGGELWCMATEVILICSHIATLLLPQS